MKYTRLALGLCCLIALAVDDRSIIHTAAAILASVGLITLAEGPNTSGSSNS